MPRAKKRNNEPMTQPSVASSQNNNILYIMMGVITLFLIFMVVKVISLEKKLGASNTGTAAPQAQQESPISVVNLKKYAKELGLDTGKFNKCLDSSEKTDLIKKDGALAATVGVQGTPGFFINGQFLAGAFPFEIFKEIIDKQIDGTASSDCTAEFSDFECPFCVRAYPTVKQILSEYKNDVKLYYKHLPLVNIHPNAQKAAEASLCAADQGKFWEFHDKVFELEAKAQGQ